MFCGKCGAENDDKAGFCRGCGAPLTAGTAGKKPAPASVGRNKIFIIAGAAAVAIIAVILAVVLSGGRSSQKAAGKFLDAVFQADGEALAGLMPGEMSEAIADAVGSKGEMAEALGAELKQVCALFDRYYPGWEYSYKAIGEEDAASMGRIREGYEKYGVTVSGARNVEMEITIKYDGGKDSETVTIPVIKSGKSWYFDFENCDLDDIFHFSGSTPASGSAASESRESTASSESVSMSSDPDWVPEEEEEEEPEKEVLEDGQLNLGNDAVLEYYIARDTMKAAPYENELDVYDTAYDLVVYRKHEYVLERIGLWDSMDEVEKMAVYVLMHLGEDVGWSWYTTEFADYVTEHVPAEDLEAFAEAAAANREAREAYEGETDLEAALRDFILPRYLEHFGEE